MCSLTRNRAERGIVLLTALAALVVMSFLVGLTHWLTISSVRLERLYRSGAEATQGELGQLAHQYLSQTPATLTKFQCLDATTRSFCSLQGKLFDFSRALSTTSVCQNLVLLKSPQTDLFSSSVQSNYSCALAGSLKDSVFLRANIEGTQITVASHEPRSLIVSGFFKAAKVQANGALTIMAGGDIRISQLITSNDITLISGTGVVAVRQISGSPQVSAFAAQGVFMPAPNAELLSENVPLRSFEPIGFLPIPK